MTFEPQRGILLTKKDARTSFRLYNKCKPLSIKLALLSPTTHPLWRESGNTEFVAEIFDTNNEQHRSNNPPVAGVKSNLLRPMA